MNPLINLEGKLTTKDEEIHITYRGPSFKEGMLISDLRKELDSIENLILDLIDELYNDKKISISSKDVKIYLKIEKGSFWETIFVYLGAPVISGIISGVIVGIINRILNKKSSKENEINRYDGNITINYFIVKNVKYLANPLKKPEDKVEIKSGKEPSIRTEIIFSDKKLIAEHLKKIEAESIYENIEKNLLGYLLKVDLKKEKFGFLLERYDKIVSAEFETHINLNEIKKILGERIKIKAYVTYKNEEIHKVKVISYEIVPEKTIDDFLEG